MVTQFHAYHKSLFFKEKGPFRISISWYTSTMLVSSDSDHYPPRRLNGISSLKFWIIKEFDSDRVPTLDRQAILFSTAFRLFYESLSHPNLFGIGRLGVSIATNQYLVALGSELHSNLHCRNHSRVSKRILGLASSGSLRCLVFNRIPATVASLCLQMRYYYEHFAQAVHKGLLVVLRIVRQALVLVAMGKLYQLLFVGKKAASSTETA